MLIAFTLDDDQYRRLATLAAEHREKVNRFFAERDLPQLGEKIDLAEFARARLLVAMEFDEELAAAIAGGVSWT